MKNKLFLILAVSLCLVGCKSAKSLTPIEIKKYSVKKENYKVEVNPTIEILSIISRLAEMETANTPYYGNSDYLSAVDTFFGKYKNHEAVKQVKSFIKKYRIILDDMISLALVISDDMTDLTVDLKNPPPYLNAVWKKINTKKFLQAVNAFAIDSKFNTFYVLQNPKYIVMGQGFLDALESGNIETWLNDFYMGGETQNFTIHTSELLGGDGFHFEIPNENKKSGFDYVICSSPYLSKEYEDSLAREISRSYVRPKIERLWDEKSERTINALKTINEKQGYKFVPEKELVKMGKNRLTIYITDTNILGFLRDYCEEEDFQNYYDSLKKDSSKEIFEKFEVELKRFDEENGKTKTFDDFISEECDLVIEIFEYQASL